MKKKNYGRLPVEMGQGVLPGHASIKSPWEKLLGYRDTMHFISRYNSVVSSAVMQALRIIIPDYPERAQLMSEEAYARLTFIQKSQRDGMAGIEEHNVHPFCRGNFVGGLTGDAGDENILLCGRVNDFGTYRVEKELDFCDWDIVGSELCRATTMSLQATADVMADCLRPGTKLDYCMHESRGTGDRHCRIVAESRDKYPMPEHELWESFGPIATEDLIKDTPDEEFLKESMIFREECDFTFVNGTNMSKDPTSALMLTFANSATIYILPAIDYAIKKGLVEEKNADHILSCICEAAGKSAFGELYAIEGLRDWLGVPNEIGYDDGRVLGGQIEMYLQGMMVEYEIEAFNKDEVIYVLDRNKLSCGYPKFVDCLVAYWYGASKTLVNAQWSLWEEAGDVPKDKLRIKIAKKIDKFC